MPEQIHSVSYVKSHLAQVIDQLKHGPDVVTITQNGAGTAVLQDLASYQRMRDGLAMLKLVAMGEQDVKKGRTVPQAEVFAALRRRLRSAPKA